MRHRTPRNLHDSEVALWAHVTRGVKPLAGRRYLPPEPTGLASTMAPAKPAKKVPVAPPADEPPRAFQPPPLAPIERRMLTALRRGRQSIEGVIDLHGMRQDEAHRALSGFIAASQARGAKLVLVVTGKGGSGMGEEARGVLRRNVPHWLRLPELRPFVLGFEEASRQHGGEGALYVRLRRHRDGP